MSLRANDDQWRISDELWQRMEPLLPPRPFHPLGCHNPRVPDRAAMDAILLVLRGGCSWNGLNATTICSCSSAYRRFREWHAAGVFVQFQTLGLSELDGMNRVDWKRVAAAPAAAAAPVRIAEPELVQPAA